MTNVHSDTGLLDGGGTGSASFAQAGQSMGKWLLHRGGISSIVMASAIASASAQFQWPPDLSAPPAQVEPVRPAEPSTPSGIPQAKKLSVPAGPAVIGKWKGELTQIGSNAPYKLQLSVSPTGGETKYPDLHCTGKLIRIGASKSYAFFIEVVTQGASTKGGNCPDGTITMARSGDKLALSWFGAVDGNMIIAYGTLSK
jgi:hypothetical protein